MYSFEPSDLDSIDGETASLDFKAYFDPASKQDWCELIKDIIAMTNSGGGRIVIGVTDDGSPSGADVAALLRLDYADVTNKIHSYTDQHFASFQIAEDRRFGLPVAVFHIESSRMPIVFTAHGGYSVQGGGQKAAFVKGSVYFRHGAKSEPGTTEDLRSALERELERVKGFWLDGIGKVMAAPDGSTVQVIQQDVMVRDSPEAIAVRLTKDKDAGKLEVGSVSLQDLPGAAAIRLTTDESAPTLNVVQADKLYPHRQKELIKRFSERLDGRVSVSGHDLQCVRKVFSVDDNPTFTYQAQHSPRKYTDAFLDWLVEQFVADQSFFQKARDVCRSRGPELQKP
jgi:hypothetical protein